LNDRTKYAYLGKFPKSFFTYPTSKGNLFVSVHLYFQIFIGDIPFKLNEAEIANVWWIPLNQFVFPKKTDIVKKFMPAPPSIESMKPRSVCFKKAVNLIFSGFEGSDTYGLNIIKDQFLYGFTFYVTIYMLRIMRNVMTQNSTNTIQNSLKDLNFLVDSCLKPELRYSKKSCWGKKEVMGYAFYIKRQKQFENIVNNQFGIKMYLILFILLCLMIRKYCITSS